MSSSGKIRKPQNKLGYYVSEVWGYVRTADGKDFRKSYTRYVLYGLGVTGPHLKTNNPKTLRAIAKHLLKCAKWLEQNKNKVGKHKL